MFPFGNFLNYQDAVSINVPEREHEMKRQKSATGDLASAMRSIRQQEDLLRMGGVSAAVEEAMGRHRSMNRAVEAALGFPSNDITRSIPTVSTATEAMQSAIRDISPGITGDKLLVSKEVEAARKAMEGLAPTGIKSAMSRDLEAAMRTISSIPVTAGNLGPSSAVLEATRGFTTGTLKDLEPYRSSARDVLDLIGSSHSDTKPANLRPRPSRAEGTKPAVKSPEEQAISSPADIGKRVRGARRAMGMTQQRFADLAGVGRRFLVELEQGKATLEIGRVLAVCTAAGVRIGFVT
jgi:y4mF family transcriptional regulator